MLLAATAAASAAPSPARAVDHAISILDGGFDPAQLTVVVGEPVTWTNTTLSTREITSDDGSLASGPIGPGEAFGHVFDQPGSTEYYDAGNTAIRGMITVLAAPETTIPSGSLEPTPPPGTLPPDFSPQAPSTPVEAASSSPSVPGPTATATPVPAPSDSSSGSGLAPAVAVLVGIAVIVALAAFVRSARRPGR